VWREKRRVRRWGSSRRSASADLSMGRGPWSPTVLPLRSSILFCMQTLCLYSSPAHLYRAACGLRTGLQKECKVLSACNSNYRVHKIGAIQGVK
jgi:hypothetical protein